VTAPSRCEIAKLEPSVGRARPHSGTGWILTLMPELRAKRFKILPLIAASPHGSLSSTIHTENSPRGARLRR